MFYEIYNEDDFEIISEYIGRKSPIKIRCKHCGKEYTKTPHTLFDKRCKFVCECVRPWGSWCMLTHEEFCQKVHEKYGDKYEVVSEYKGGKKEIKLKHKKCGTIFPVTQASHVIAEDDNILCPCETGCRFDKDVNSIAVTHPELAKLFYNPEDAWNYTYSSTRKTDFLCPDCKKKIRNKIIHNVYTNGLQCPFCSDNMSFGERLVFSLLTMKISYLDDENFIHDQTQKWSDGKRYDFYFLIDGVKYIVETDGGQHMVEKPNAKYFNNLKKEIENDKYKEDLAFQNGVLKENFIRIDCFYSDYDYIKQNIINSPLYNLLELESFDWETCFKDAATSKLLIICDLWNSGERSFKVLNKKTGLSSSGIRSYLKRGTEIGLCSYEALGVCKKVRCKNDGTIFKSISEATRFYNLTSGHISDVCNGKRNFAGKHPITNQPLLWEYV